MNVCIVKEDNVVVVDGEALNFPLDLEEYIWAVQWNGTTGEIEFYGLYRINIYTPLAEGKAGTYPHIQELGLLFKNGTIITRSGYEIKIDKLVPTQGFKQTNWYVTPVTISWSCRMTLN